MSKLRAVLAQLPFVSQKADGSLDLWDVTPTGDTQKDLMMGRQYFAWLLHVMREFDAPYLLFHVGTAWHSKRDLTHDVKAGWTYELSDALAAADPNCPQLMMANADYSKGDIRDAMLQLPFVSERPDGTLNCFDVNWDGSLEELQARGRHYAALTAKFLRDTRHPSFLGFLALSVPAEHGCSDLRVGFLNDLVQIAVTALPTSTVNQRSTLPLFQEAVKMAENGPKKNQRAV